MFNKFSDLFFFFCMCSNCCCSLFILVRPYRCGRLVGQKFIQLTNTLCFHRIRCCFFCFFKPNRFQLLHIPYRFARTRTHLRVACSCKYMCVLTCACVMCVHTVHSQSIQIFTNTTRLLIYRYLYMFALVVVTFIILYSWNTFALLYFVIFNTFEIHHLKNPLQNTFFQQVTLFRLLPICSYFFSRSIVFDFLLLHFEIPS